jgi:hypothetical protein
MAETQLVPRGMRRGPAFADALESVAREYRATRRGKHRRRVVYREFAARWGISDSWAHRLILRTVRGCREWDAAAADGLIVPPEWDHEKPPGTYHDPLAKWRR